MSRSNIDPLVASVGRRAVGACAVVFAACAHQEPSRFSQAGGAAPIVVRAATQPATIVDAAALSPCMLKSREIGMPLDQYNALTDSQPSLPRVLERSDSNSCMVIHEPHWDPEVRERIRVARASVLASILPCAYRISTAIQQRYAESLMSWHFTINHDGRIRMARPALPLTPFSECVATEVVFHQVAAAGPLPPLVFRLPPTGWRMFHAAPPAGLPASNAEAVLKYEQNGWRAVVPYK